MKIIIAGIGKLKRGPERELFSRYIARATATGRQAGINGLDLAERSESRAGTADLRKLEEAGHLRGMVGADFIALDERGRDLSSNQFAAELGQIRDLGVRQLGFVIGGADGLDPQMIPEARFVMSLSRLTLPHQLARVFLAEQLYRAMTILSGHPYHRDG